MSSSSGWAVVFVSSTTAASFISSSISLSLVIVASSYSNFDCISILLQPNFRQTGIKEMFIIFSIQHFTYLFFNGKKTHVTKLLSGLLLLLRLMSIAVIDIFFYLWFFIIPLCYCCFSSILSVTFNFLRAKMVTFAINPLIVAFHEFIPIFRIFLFS